MHDNRSLKQLLKTEAIRLGFSDCGIARAEPLTAEFKQLKEWLNRDYQGDMSYLENKPEYRANPQNILPTAKSVIVVIHNYYTKLIQLDPEAPVISKYAYSKDYHTVIGQKLIKLLDYIHNQAGHVNGRIFVDSVPVMEKALACKAGLGWRGKNSLLLTGQYGSFVFIGGLITDIDLEPDMPVYNHCGECNLCIDACPTGAIVMPGVINASRCISYLTIELKSEKIPVEFRGKFRNRIFGCDICQEVCPWNKNALQHKEPSLMPNTEILSMTKKEWYDLDEAAFNKIFDGSAVKRAKFSGLKRNLEFLKD